MATPEALLRRLELTVLRPLDGLLFGDYRVLFYGEGLELGEIRPYSPGDEARRMDWPATARTGTLQVRRFLEERELLLWLLLDTSPSMRFGSRGRTKYQLALELALALAQIAIRRGNRVGGMVGGHLLPPKGGRVQALRLARLALEAPPDPTPLGARLEGLFRVARRRGLVFVLSDFLDEFYAPLARLSLRHDLVALLLEDPLERELEVGGIWRFQDPETGLAVTVNALDPRVRRAYRERAKALDERRVKAIGKAGAELLRASTGEEPWSILLRFVRRRRWRSKAQRASS